MKIIPEMIINTKEWLSKANAGAKDIRLKEILFWKVNNCIKSFQIHIGKYSFNSIEKSLFSTKIDDFTAFSEKSSI